MHKFLNAFIVLAFFLLVSEIAGIIGAFVTIPSIHTWYAGLHKPSFSPPDVVFGPVWTALYFMIGLAAFFVYRKHKKQHVKMAIILFALQLGLNVAWSVLFFGMHLPVLALVEIVVLWFAIALTIRQFFKVSETGAFLLVPYFLWVTFAVILNCAIVVLN